MTKGYIPERIKFVYSVEVDIDGTEVFPAFPVDSTNKRTTATAENWAKQLQTSYKWKSRLENPDESEVPVRNLERDNSPMTGVRILGLEIRNKGGRAWKGITPDRFYVDIREDTMLQSIMTDGISPGGVLVGTFVFALVNNQMKVLKVGSELWEELSKKIDSKLMPYIPKGDLIPGHIYEDKSERKSLFIGHVYTSDMELFEEESVSQWSYFRPRTQRPGKILKPKKMSLWLLGNDYDKKEPDPQGILSLLSDRNKSYGYIYVDVKSSTNVVTHLGPSAFTVPSVSEIREHLWECHRLNNLYHRGYGLLTEPAFRSLIMVPYKDKESFSIPEELIRYNSDGYGR